MTFGREPGSDCAYSKNSATLQLKPGRIDSSSTVSPSAKVRAAVAGVPRLAVCGAALDGVGIPACVAAASLAASAVVAQVSAG